MTQEQHGTILLVIISFIIYIISSIFMKLSISFLSITGFICLSLLIWNNFLINKNEES